VQKEAALKALLGYVLALAAKRPVLMIFEDVQVDCPRGTTRQVGQHSYHAPARALASVCTFGFANSSATLFVFSQRRCTITSRDVSTASRIATRWVFTHKELGIRYREPYHMRHTSVHAKWLTGLAD
jgi:hypothetical protein